MSLLSVFTIFTNKSREVTIVVITELLLMLRPAWSNLTLHLRASLVEFFSI